MSTKRIIREQLEVIRGEAESLGAEYLGWSYGSKHPFALLRVNGREERVFFGGTPSCGDAHLADMLRQKVRRVVGVTNG